MWDCSNLGFYEHYLVLQRIYKLSKIPSSKTEQLNYKQKHVIIKICHVMKVWPAEKWNWEEFVPHKFLYYHGRDLVSLVCLCFIPFSPNGSLFS